MSIAAGADLRPLFHFFGIIADDAVTLESQILANNLPQSLTLYNRLQEYKTLLPADSTAFTNYALTIYPNLFTNGPTSNSDFGVGWFYQKSLTYDVAEKDAVEATLQGIIDLYYPAGAPVTDTNPTLCCVQEEICDGIDNNGDGTIDEILTNTWIGPAYGNWYDNTSYWSLCHFPNNCNHIVIEAEHTVSLRNGEIGYGYTLEVQEGAVFCVEDGAELAIEQ